MPDTKITALTALTAADPANDVLPIVDVSDTTMAASGTTKKISINNVLGCSGTATLASATITGNLTVDTNTLFVDSTNNRVGIGTATPQQTFEVVGGTAGINTIFNTGSAGDSRFELRNNNVRSGYVYWDTAEVRLFADTSRALTFYQNGTLGMTLNSTGLGVGGSPTRKLSIVGSGATYANINSGDNTSLVGVLFGGTSAPSAGQVIYDNTANSMGLYTAGAVKLTIDSSGNLGIGITNPSHRLHALVSSGADRDIFAAQVLSASNGLQVKWNHATTTLRVILANIPTSSAGLAAGTLWNDAGTIKIA